MKAIGFTRHGGPDVLEFCEIPDPVPEPRDVVVRVRSAGVNPVDSKVRRGMRGSLRPGQTVVPGWDAAGVVEAVGRNARRFQVGDEVYFSGDVNRAGSYAELVAVDERIVGRKPRSLSFEEAASVPLVAITAWESILENLGVGEGQGDHRSILILGGAGGVGSIAIQIARRVCGLLTIATASRPDSASFCRQMGADEVIDHGKDLAPQLASIGRPTVELIHSNAPVNDFVALAGVLSPLGRINCILPAPQADLSGLFAKRGSVHFELMFCRPAFDAEPERQGALLDRVADLIDREVLETAVTRIVDWSDVRIAHEEIDSEHTVGKIVLKIA